MERQKQTIAAAIMIATFLAAFDVTVLATATPTIVADLGDMSMSSWIFSMYLFFSAVSTPLYGKLADLYGRRKILTIGILIFMFGSLGCGLSGSMTSLVFWRAVQGLGTGSIFTVTPTIVGDLYTLKERAIVQGGISTTWGVAGLVGPVLGGLFIDFLNWHWVFFVNVPFCLICLAAFERYLKESRLKKKPVIDYAGAFLLTLAVGALLYACMAGIEQGTALYAVGAAILAGAAFRRVEEKAAEPVIPPDILTRPMLLNLTVTLLISVTLIALNVYIPSWLQQVHHVDATLSGLALASMSFAWMLSSFSMERVLFFLGLRRAVVFSCFIIAATAAALAVWGDRSYLTAVTIDFFFGFGFSGVLTLLMFMIQDAVPYEKRGAAVGTGALTRSIGQTLGIAAIGTFVNVSINSCPRGTSLESALSLTFHRLFLVIAVLAVCAALVSMFLPKVHEVHRK